MRFSIEREFFLYNKNRKPVGKRETNMFLNEARRAFNRHGIKEHLDVEVAGNGIELVLPFLTIDDYKERYLKALATLKDVANNHLLIFPLSQKPIGLEHNEFFTTLAFSNSIPEFESTAGIHMHVAVSSFAEMFDMFNRINTLSPFDSQDLAWLPGGRKSVLKKLFKVLDPLSSFVPIHSMKEYIEFLSYLNVNFMRKHSNKIPLLYSNYPHMFFDGQVYLTPDKIFTPNARARPDLRTPDFVGSVEIRFLDGSSSIDKDIEKIEHLLDILNGSSPMKHYENIDLELEHAIEKYGIW